MGIYIKGMEMPKVGNETIVRIQPDGTILDQYGHHLAITAISVPPHGKLGDLDMLDFNNCKHFIVDGVPDVNLNDIAVIIKDAPIIIPAEVEEENSQREYEMAVEAAQYCELYEPTYDPETGAL